MSDYVYIPSSIIGADKPFSAFVTRQMMQDNVDLLWTKSAGDLCCAPGTLNPIEKTISSTDWDNVFNDFVWVPIYPSRTSGVYRGFSLEVRCKGTATSIEMRAILSAHVPTDGDAIHAIYDTQTLPTSYDWVTFDLSSPYYAQSHPFTIDSPQSIAGVFLNFAVRRSSGVLGSVKIIEIRLNEETS